MHQDGHLKDTLEVCGVTLCKKKSRSAQLGVLKRKCEPCMSTSRLELSAIQFEFLEDFANQPAYRAALEMVLPILS